MGQLATGLLSLSGWAALAFLFLLPALEAPAFLGLVLPGELALLLGVVLAHQDRIPLDDRFQGVGALMAPWGPGCEP
jgi:undecaprenyl-diphosphatase